MMYRISYFRCPPTFGITATVTEISPKVAAVAFDRNRKYAESATMYTFGAETETETEIRSTFNFVASTKSIFQALFVQHVV